MRNLKGTKCEFGYISKQKIYQSLMLLLFIAAGAGLFLVGLLITGTRANVFTVLGILMVLPGAKRVIALVVMVPHHSVEKERYDKMRAAISKEAVLLTDYVFTSTEKIMSLDFVVVENKNVIGILDGKKQDVTYIVDYLKKGIMGKASDYKVKILASDDEFYRFYKKMAAGQEKNLQEDEKQQKRKEEVVQYLKVLAV